MPSRVISAPCTGRPNWAALASRASHVRVPVTLAWPEHDRLVARPVHLPPAVRSVALPDAGHVPVWDAPEAVADLLLS